MEYDSVGIDLKNEILREEGRCCAGMIFRFAVTAVTRKSILFEILLAEGTQTSHMNKCELIILAARILGSQIGIKRKIFCIDMQNRTRGIISVAIAFAVNVTVKIERVFAYQ